VKILRLIFLLAIFLTSLYVGFQAGFLTAPHSQAATASQAVSPLASVAAEKEAVLPPTQPAPPAAPPTGQRSILVIGVDNLAAAQPKLESIWLALFVPPDPRLTFLPVYPSFSRSEKEDRRLLSSFQYQPGAALNPEFVQVLQSRQIWWTGSVILDRYAYAQVMNYLAEDGNAAQTVAYLDGENWVKKLAEAAGKPQEAIANQATIYQELCWRTAKQNWSLSDTIQQEISNRLAGHTQVDFNLAQSLRETGMLTATSSLFCDFPTLYAKTQVIK
jgi:hypothetical protein